MTRYNEGDWVEYRHHEGYLADGKILEQRPDGKYVIGQHDEDPNPNTVDSGSVVRRV
jgi:hypothetical protein